MVSVPQILDLNEYSENGMNIEDSSHNEFHIVPETIMNQSSSSSTDKDIIIKLKQKIEYIKSTSTDSTKIDEFIYECLQIIKSQYPIGAMKILTAVFENE